MVVTSYPVPGIFTKFVVLQKILLGALYLMHRYLYTLYIKRIKPKFGKTENFGKTKNFSEKL